jgi:hypothetical protein
MEKTAQVRMMGDIYQHADLVIAWLGKEDTFDQLGYSLMMILCKYFGSRQVEQSMQFSYEDILSSEIAHLPAIEWSSMVNIMRRPWFWRAWVVQEFVLAKRRIFKCGEVDMEPEYFLGAFERLNAQLPLRLVAHFNGSEIMSGPGPFFSIAGYNKLNFTLFDLVTLSGRL